MGEEAEEFLLLDEEEETPVSEKPVKEPFSLKSMFSSIKLPSLPKPKSKPANKSAPAIEAVATSAGDSIDLDLSADGVHEFEWSISGMDCPDCAMKATRAVSRLPGIEECRISVTQGTVRLQVDVSRGRISRASSVLENLGHSPETEWLSVNGITPKMAAARIGADKRKLRNALMNVPGILDVRLSEGRIEIQKMWISDPDL
ncbi:MAG: cation transporter, partial [Candidatus Thermoplasmatota archaeon]|nr:cation transporter [Candidatus Thermoplasmatota archaeon]